MLKVPDSHLFKELAGVVFLKCLKNVPFWYISDAFHLAKIWQFLHMVRILLHCPNLNCNINTKGWSILHKIGGDRLGYISFTLNFIGFLELLCSLFPSGIRFRINGRGRGGGNFIRPVEHLIKFRINFIKFM